MNGLRVWSNKTCWFVEEHYNFSWATQVHFLDDVKSFAEVLDEAENLLEDNRVNLYGLATKLVVPNGIAKNLNDIWQ